MPRERGGWRSLLVILVLLCVVLIYEIVTDPSPTSAEVDAAEIGALALAIASVAYVLAQMNYRDRP